MFVATLRYSRISDIVLLSIPSFAARTLYEEILTSYLATWSNIEYVVFAYHCRFRLRNASTQCTIAVISNACESRYLRNGRAMPQFRSDGRFRSARGWGQGVFSRYDIKIPIQREAQTRMRVTGMYFHVDNSWKSHIFVVIWKYIFKDSGICMSRT